MDCNQALRQLTAQVETLTKVVDRHSDFLKVHEARLIRLEKFLAENEFEPAAKKGEKTNLKLPLPTADDLKLK
jgi:hypothetical protein